MTNCVNAIALVVINAKTIRNVSFLAQTILLTTLNDMHGSLLEVFGRCEVTIWQVRDDAFVPKSFSERRGKSSHRLLKESMQKPTGNLMIRRVSMAAFLFVCLSLSCSAGTPALSAYVGNSPAELRQFEIWLGRPVDQIAAHTGRANWKDWVSSISWSVELWSPLNKPIRWTIPMFADGGSLADAAARKYQSFYEQAARSLAQTRPPDSVIYVRTGEEFNGNWMPWSAAGREQDFVKAYRNFVEAFRSVSNRFRFEWNANIRETRMNPVDAYPGDDYVDVISMDFYYNTKWNPTNPVQAWNEMVSGQYGLQWLEDFAAAHHKPTAYPEWGVNSDGAGPYIEKAAQWFSAHNVLYQSVWNSNDDFPGKLTENQYPKAATAYIDSFGPKAVDQRQR